MPELPEVETIVRGLRGVLPGKMIVEIDVRTPSVLAGVSEKKFKTALTGSRITGVRRRAKMLLLELGPDLTLLIHLRMTGSLVYCASNAPERPHTHLVFNFDDARQLRFADTRRFGFVKLVTEGAKAVVAGLGDLGPEPLDHFTEADLRRMLRVISNSRRPIKTWLIDQSWIAGIGNLYADEILFEARIRPDRRPGSLTRAEIGALHTAIGKVLNAAIDKGGSSFSDYVDSQGEKGEFHHQLNVYRRAGLPCNVCGAPIVRIKLGGRSTHYCSRDQK